MRKHSSEPESADPPSVPSWARLWAFAFGIATLLGWFTVLWVYFGMLANNKPLPFSTAVFAGLTDWYFWAALTPPVFWLGQRFRFGRRTWPRQAAILMLAGVAVALVELLLVTSVQHRFYYNPYAPAPREFWDAYVQNVLRSFQFAFIIYWLIVAAAQAFGYYREERRRELDASRLRLANAELEARLSRAQLHALRAQLHPHFLFNALNTISGFVRQQRNGEATELVARLGGLLRRSLGTRDRNEVPLRDELEFVDAYLAIERARFGDRLEVHYEIEPATLDANVPAMILQPLVENAIRHGLQETAVGRLWIRARRENGGVCLQVQDDGRGLNGARGSETPSGLGLANLRARLDRLYGRAYAFELTEGDPAGVEVSIRIPGPAAREAEAR